MPEGLDYNDKPAMDQWIKALPFGAMLMLLFAWFLGALTSSFVASYFDELNALQNSVYLTVFLLIATIINLYQIPHPYWMWFGGIFSIIAGASLGVKLFIKYWSEKQIVNGKWINKLKNYRMKECQSVAEIPQNCGERMLDPSSGRRSRRIAGKELKN